VELLQAFEGPLSGNRVVLRYFQIGNPIDNIHLALKASGQEDDERLTTAHIRNCEQP
jgi:hypothetical protein